MSTNNWKTMLDDALKSNSETWDDVVQNTLTDAELIRMFDAGFGGSEGTSFTLWTKDRVYFPTVYDGSEWVSSVSRNPDGKPTPHVGGE